MKEIQLTRGFVAMVDDADYERLAAVKWYAFPGKRACYARGCVRTDGRMRPQLMHRFILGIADKNLQVDHRDGNGLNNARANLRIVTPAQNRQNRVKKNMRTTSRFKGVSWKPKLQKWQASLKAGRWIYLGIHDREEDAARAYDAGALKHFGEFARLNFPEGD